MSVSKPLRVLQVGKYYPPHCGGMETHIKALCDALQSHVEINVLVANDTRKTVRTLVDGIPVTRVGTLGRVASAPISPALPLFIRKIPADVIHVHMPHPAAVPAYFAAARGTPLVITYHSDIVRQRLLGKMFDPFLEQALRRAIIICTSQQYLESSLPLRQHHDRCRVVPLSINIGDYCRKDDITAARHITGQYGPKIILAVGRLVYYKGYEYLIRSMRTVDAILLIIGKGPLRKALEELAGELGVSERVKFLGEVEQTAPYYHAADIFVLPSIARSEAFGIVQLEAMACGKPVINTQLDTGVPFVSLNGITGLTVPPADSGALAKAINHLLRETSLRQALGLAGRQRVNQHFTVKRMADDTLQILQEAALLPANLLAQSISNPASRANAGNR